MFIALTVSMVAEASLPMYIPIRVGQRFGYCDAAMNLLIPATFDDAKPFQQDRAIVQQSQKFGLIDPSGSWILKPEYDEIVQGKHLRLKKGKRFALCDWDGCLLTDFDYDALYELRGGFVLLDQGGRKGIANAEGRVIVPALYEHVNQLRDDQGNRADLVSVQMDGLMGLYNTCGDIVQPPRFSRIDVFQEGFAVVQEGAKFGLIDLEGHLRVNCEYDQLHGVSEGLAAAKLKNRWGFVDGQGRQALPFLFESVQDGGFFQGRASVNKAGTWVFLQRNGEVEFPLDNGFQSLGSLSEGLIPICKLVDQGGVLFGYVDPEGKSRIPLRYERAEAFFKGFAIVGGRMSQAQTMVKEMRYGIIDRNGRSIIPMVLHSQTEARLKRDSLGYLGYATISHRGRACKVDSRGHRFDCELDQVGHIQKVWVSTRCETCDLVAVARDGLWGYCDPKGKIVIPCQYASVDCFSDGLARVTTSGPNSIHYYIDAQGRAYYLPAA